MKYATIYKEHDNIFVLKFSRTDATEANFSKYLKELKQFYKENQDFVMIIDGSDSKYLDKKFRNYMGKWIADNEDLIKKKCIAQVYVIPSPIIRYILQAIFLVKKPPVPFTIVNNFPEAQEQAVKLNTLSQK
ncbi:MAG: hypothetical protein JXJ22_16770 [Bacteroidales bacterium]|nr:hypothetical protein [Bacteroidales bacterium]